MTVQTNNTVAANTSVTAHRTSINHINKLIGKVKTQGASFIALVQETAVAIIEHSNIHGDCTSAAHLVSAMPENGVRRAGVVQYFRMYGGINVYKNGKTGLLDAKRQRDDNGNLVDGDLDKARANNWYDTNGGRDPVSSFQMEDALKKIENLVKFVETRIKMTRKDKDGNDVLVNGKPVLVVTDDFERQRLRHLANTLKGVEKSFMNNPIAAPTTGSAPVETQTEEVRTGTDG